jgi:hypothetical protein
MRRDDPNLPYLQSIATALGDLCERLVFVGGSTAGLLITEAAAEGVRPTRDVDVIVEAGSRRSGKTGFDPVFLTPFFRLGEFVAVVETWLREEKNKAGALHKAQPQPCSEHVAGKRLMAGL